MSSMNVPETRPLAKVVLGSQRTGKSGGLRPCNSVNGAMRPHVRGKFLFVGEEKRYVRGVTYGPFHPDAEGNEYPTQDVIEHDFAQMAANGINTVRTYTPPPRMLLDMAYQHGLYVMLGLAADQYVGFLTDRRGAPDIVEEVRAKVRICAGHPALLCYAIGNEIPASFVRWLGHRRVERYLESLYRAIKTEDPGGLVTYVSYPSTEYLQLPFLDLLCFNVYLEASDRLDAYLARLQNLAGDRPLMLSEIGLDSLRHGEDAQAYALDWQVRAAFAGGCAGAIVFSWTDEWFTGGTRGTDVDDWKFGITDQDRRPKPALAAVRQAFSEVPFPPGQPWPRISVVVCSYNGARTIGGCLEGLMRLEYPDFEVIVVDDGSTDRTADIAAAYAVKLIRTANGGLGRARNIGLAAATGEIVAYLDDDAYPDSHWLTYLAATFLSTTHVGVGGPNIAPAGDGLIADCVASAPGNPTHVLLSDQEAEHIPGCNMAFRKVCLQAIDGFDPQFRVAGDDVDVCWRLRQCGWTLGFSPAAVVWHHRRGSLPAYWKQQYGYGKAEAPLERKWSARYNAIGHYSWAGRVYGMGRLHRSGRVGRIYQGVWGSAPFQSLYEPAPGAFWSLALLPEWYLVILALGALSALGILWRPLLLVFLPMAFAVSAPIAQAWLSADRSPYHSMPRLHATQLKLRTLTAALYVLQPVARLHGRLSGGLTPWRTWRPCAVSLPRRWSRAFWTEQWQAPDQRLHAIETALQRADTRVSRGGDYDRWDLEIQCSPLSTVRMLMAVEEPGAGAQLIRLRLWPRCSAAGLIVTLLFGALSAFAALGHVWVVCAALGVVALLLALSALYGCAAATGVTMRVFMQAGYTQARRTAHQQSGVQAVETAESALP